MRVVRVVAALIQRSGPSGPRYLVQQRSPQETRGLLWEFPGGKVEPGEDDAAGLRRELREELGIEVTVGALLDSVNFAYPDLTLDLALYPCAIASGEARALHAHALRWEVASALPALPFTEADVPFVTRLAAGTYALGG
jgi:8-oxo-dGTP diphosphatase